MELERPLTKLSDKELLKYVEQATHNAQHVANSADKATVALAHLSHRASIKSRNIAIFSLVVALTACTISLKSAEWNVNIFKATSESHMATQRAELQLKSVELNLLKDILDANKPKSTEYPEFP